MKNHVIPYIINNKDLLVTFNRIFDLSSYNDIIKATELNKRNITLKQKIRTERKNYLSIVDCNDSNNFVIEANYYINDLELRSLPLCAFNIGDDK